LLTINNTEIGKNKKPYIIAEMSGNHNKSLDRALEIVKAAADTGANALKLQTYTADTITLKVKNEDFLIKDKNSLWNNRYLYDLYNEAHTPWEWHEPIMKQASSLGLTCFSSPFDETAVEFLEDLNVEAYKIASFENMHYPLIEKVVSTKKPIIVSTGMSSVSEINDTVTHLRNFGSENFALLKCTSTYPASPKNTNVITIPHMRKLFGCEIGLSDHTMGIGASIAAISHGASIIEKHFTLDRNDGGVDSAFSLEPAEMKSLVVESERAWQSLGNIKYGASESEKKSKIFRRSIYVSQDMEKGDIFNESNIRIVRPGKGLAPKHYKSILGRKINSSTKKGTALDWSKVI
tara:strand:- start:216 stop:1262 length:1047 start_codon:yes stop_codon:yes gene_type:complete